MKFSVRDRDLGSTIADAQAHVVKNVKLPSGYSIGWTGEFENQVRATSRLAQVVPISLILIFVLLFIMFGNIQDASLVLANVPFALIGGICALHVTGMNFGISAGVGFIALFGICIQNGVILISEFHNNLKQRMELTASIIAAVKVRTRPCGNDGPYGGYWPYASSRFNGYRLGIAEAAGHRNYRWSGVGNDLYAAGVPDLFITGRCVKTFIVLTE